MGNTSGSVSDTANMGNVLGGDTTETDSQPSALSQRSRSKRASRSVSFKETVEYLPVPGAVDPVLQPLDPRPPLRRRLSRRSSSSSGSMDQGESGFFGAVASLGRGLISTLFGEPENVPVVSEHKTKAQAKIDPMVPDLTPKDEDLSEPSFVMSNSFDEGCVGPLHSEPTIQNASRTVGIESSITSSASREAAGKKSVSFEAGKHPAYKGLAEADEEDLRTTPGGPADLNDKDYALIAQSRTMHSKSSESVQTQLSEESKYQADHALSWDTLGLDKSRVHPQIIQQVSLLGKFYESLEKGESIQSAKQYVYPNLDIRVSSLPPSCQSQATAKLVVSSDVGILDELEVLD